LPALVIIPAALLAHVTRADGGQQATAHRSEQQQAEEEPDAEHRESS
jgi:hypothetical protein